MMDDNVINCVWFIFSFCSFFFFKQKTAYEMRISDWSSDVCSSDLVHERGVDDGGDAAEPPFLGVAGKAERVPLACSAPARLLRGLVDHGQKALVASQPRAAHGEIGRAHV